MQDEKINKNRPIPINISIKQLPNIFEEFINLAERDIINSRLIGRKHKFYSAVEFYRENKVRDWTKLNIPDSVFRAVNEICHFIVILKPFLNNKSAKALFRTNSIEALCAEAVVASNYIRRGYFITWPSIYSKDPPDLIIFDPINKVKVDIEVKLREETASIETMFDSLSKGLQSLKRRGPGANERAVIAIHNSEDLDWHRWLNDPDVLKRLTSRLSNDEYKIVSGIIFSGGEIIEVSEDGAKEYCTRYVAFRSQVAAHPLPVGFLTSSGNL